MFALAAPALVLSLSAMGLDPVAFTARASACCELPANIHANDALKAEIVSLARSQTLRGQCTRIAAAGRTQVTLTLSSAPMTSRARSTARRDVSGLLTSTSSSRSASQDCAGLLAHELEHATEWPWDEASCAEPGQRLGLMKGR